MCAVFADYVRSNKLLILRVLAVTKNENKVLGFSGGKCYINLVACDRVPAACYRISCFIFFYGSRESVSVIHTKENISASIKTINRAVYAEETVMSAAFAIFGFVVNSAAFEFDFSDA